MVLYILVASLKKDKDKFNKEVQNLKSSVEAAIKQVKVIPELFFVFVFC